MSNRDYSGTTLTMQKQGKTEYAGYVKKVYDAVATRGLVRMGGGATASVTTELATGATAAGAATYGGPFPTNTTTYSLSRNILSAQGL